MCDSQIDVLGATKRDSWCQRRGRCLLVWKASPGLFRHHQSSSDTTSLTGKTKQLLVGHREKSLLLSKRVDKVATKKSHPGSLEAAEKLNGMCKAKCTRSLGVGKKGPKKQSMKSQHQKKKLFKRAEEKAIEKMPLKKSRMISKVLMLSK